MSLQGLLQRRCVLVTGKGGAGKSSVAAGLAVWAARRGRRVLLTEVGDETTGHSPLARLFGREVLPEGPEQLGPPGLRGLTLLPRTGQELFVGTVLHTTTLARAALSSEAIRKLLNAGPSFREMGVFYHLLTLLRAQRPDGTPEHELVLIDMPATGHTLSLTGLPNLLLKLVPRGPIAQALREGQSYLNDPAKGEAWVVTLPETLPISECLELLEGLARTRMPVGGVIVNRLKPDPFTAGERAALRPLVERVAVFGAEELLRHELRGRELQRLTSATSLPVLGLPECALDCLRLHSLCEALERGASLAEAARCGCAPNALPIDAPLAALADRQRTSAI
ncbi:MAG: ArsA family ATPase [Deltaproteobacteria bacterium]|nr:ArsA family ATPase [Deltaproteobacteria bacterium]